MIASVNCATRRRTIRRVRKNISRAQCATAHSAFCLCKTRYHCDFIMFRIRILLPFFGILAAVFEAGGAERVMPPPQGKLYQGLYFDEPMAGGDPTEHDVTSADVARWEKTLGTKTAWVYFSNNWSESRHFPSGMCAWVRELGKVPYVRLMLRS